MYKVDKITPLSLRGLPGRPQTPPGPIFITDGEPMLNAYRNYFPMFKVQNAAPLAWFKLIPSFPIPSKGNSYFDDTVSLSQKWYLPSFSMKNPQEGGCSFQVRKIGLDKEGNDSYEATLRLKLVRKRPNGLSDEAYLKFSEIKFTALEVSIGVSTTNGNIILPAEIVTQEPELEVKLSLKPEVVKLIYRTIAEQTATVIIKGQYLIAATTKTPPFIDLLSLAEQGRWVGARLKDENNTIDEQLLPWQGSNSNNNGFVRLEHSRLEDNEVYYALTTHPKWVSNGTIKGMLPSRLIPPQAKFTAKVGFLQGAKNTDGVFFKVWANYRENNQPIRRQIVNMMPKPYSGALIPISVDLSDLAGKELSLEFRVDCGASSAQDWAAWVAPRIEGKAHELNLANHVQGVGFSLKCSQHPELFQLIKEDGTTQAFGCQAPWSGSSLNTVAQYQVYNKVNLVHLGVAAVYMSNYINNQFLIVPSEYQIARDANNLPSAFCTAKVDLNNPEQCSAILDFGVAPALDMFTFAQIKKAIVQSWVGEDISKTISLVFPDKPLGLEWDKTLVPTAQLINDGNYALGLGNQFSLSLQNLTLLNAELIAKTISGENPPGWRFPFKIKVDDQLPLVNCSIQLSLNQLSGELLGMQPREAGKNQVVLQNPLDFDVYVRKVLSETPDKGNNAIYELNRIIPANTAISFDLNAADKGTVFFTQATGLTGNRYTLRDSTVLGDEIQQEIVIALEESIFTQAPVEFVEVKLQMKGAAAKASKVFNSVNQLNQKALISLPLGYYLSKRELEYVAIIKLKDKPEKIVVGFFNLREGALINFSKQSLGLS